MKPILWIAMLLCLAHQTSAMTISGRVCGPHRSRITVINTTQPAIYFVTPTALGFWALAVDEPDHSQEYLIFVTGAKDQMIQYSPGSRIEYLFGTDLAHMNFREFGWEGNCGD